MLLDKSHIQYLHDNSGKPTAVLIPINDWKNIEAQVLSDDIPQWQKKLLDERLKLARKHPKQLLDFDTAMLELENETD
jgi:hypothetical protein